MHQLPNSTIWQAIRNINVRVVIIYGWLQKNVNWYGKPPVSIGFFEWKTTRYLLVSVAFCWERRYDVAFLCTGERERDTYFHCSLHLKCRDPCVFLVVNSVSFLLSLSTGILGAWELSTRRGRRSYYVLHNPARTLSLSLTLRGRGSLYLSLSLSRTLTEYNGSRATPFSHPFSLSLSRVKERANLLRSFQLIWNAARVSAAVGWRL